MAQGPYKHLSARERLLISRLKAKKLSNSAIARKIGRDKSTVSRELRRNAKIVTPQDRFFLFRIKQLWTEEELDAYLETQPAAARRTEYVWCYARRAADRGRARPQGSPEASS